MVSLGSECWSQAGVTMCGWCTYTVEHMKLPYTRSGPLEQSRNPCCWIFERNAYQFPKHFHFHEDTLCVVIVVLAYKVNIWPEVGGKGSLLSFLFAGCVDMLSIEGQFTFTAEQPQLHCATFFIGDPDEIITIDFDFVNIDCSAGDFLKVCALQSLTIPIGNVCLCSVTDYAGLTRPLVDF